MDCPCTPTYVCKHHQKPATYAESLIAALPVPVDQFIAEQNRYLTRIYDAYRASLADDPAKQAEYDRYFGRNDLDRAEAIAAIAHEDANGTDELQELIDAGALEDEPEAEPVTWPAVDDNNRTDNADEPQWAEWLETA